MKASIKMFSSMMGQVSQEVGTKLGEKALSGRGRQLAAVLALGVASMSMAAPAMAQCQPDPNQQASANVAKGEGGLIGAGLGGIAGALLTHRASPLTKIAAVFGGAFIGKEMGSSIADDLHGGSAANQPGAAVGAGATHAANVAANCAQGPAGYDPQVNGGVITPRAYNEALSRSFSSLPGTANPGKRALDADLQSSFTGLLVKVAADREVASQALLTSDRAELARQFSPQDPAAKARVERSGADFQRANTAYQVDARQLFTSLSSAEQMGFDVTAQRTLASMMPNDLRKSDAYSPTWPGVQARVAEISTRQVVSLADVQAAHGDGQREAPVRHRAN